MNPEQWKRVKHVFDGALALRDQERPAYLEQARLGDTNVRQEVETLIRHHEDAADHFLNHPA